MSSKVIAINYRLEADPLAAKHQGCWKEFTDEGAARMWLNWRKNKTLTSPKGAMIYRSTDELEAALCNRKILPPSLVRAIESYLKWLNL